MCIRDSRASEQRLATEVRNAIALSAATHTEVDESLIPFIEDVLAKRRFHPVYQPVYSLTDGDLLGVEALTRFDVEPYRTPDRWFAAAALSGHGTDLEIAAIEEAVKGTADLPRDVVLSVNASPVRAFNGISGPQRTVATNAVAVDPQIPNGITDRMIGM